MNSLKNIQGMEPVSDRIKYDPNTRSEFRETKWKCGERRVDVNIDEYGFHPRVDGGDCPGALDEGGLIGWLMDVLGVRR